jgi:hypothetical protein
MVATIRKALDIILLYQGFDRFLQLLPLNKFEIVGEAHCYSVFICLI